MSSDKKNICLIIPPSLFLLDERVFVSLGILNVAAALEKAGISVEMLDLSGVQNYEDIVRSYVLNSNIRIFAVTATTPQMPAVNHIVHAIRNANSKAKIILGGPHITLVNAAYKKEKEKGTTGRGKIALEKSIELFDVLVAGDGEEAIFQALDEHAPKIVDADDPKSGLFLSKKKMDELPFPARHLVDLNTYHYSIDGVPATSLITQLGCPFECGFCGGRNSPMLRRTRIRSPQNVIEEITHLYRQYGFLGFMLYDDELNVNPKMIELMNLLCDKQKELNVHFNLRGFIKSELFNDDQAEAMFRAGFRWILVGFESGSSKILTNINKKATLEENSRCVKIARRHHLKVKALMSVGHPGESEKTISETHQWLMKAKPDDFDVSIITTYPGTPYYDEAVRNSEHDGVWSYTYSLTGDRLHSYEIDFTQVADYYKGNPDGGYRSYVFTDFLSAEELVKMRDFLERDIRKKLNIPFNPSGTSIKYEHSMGQNGLNLPQNILRTSER